MACCSADATGCSDVVLTVGALVNFVLRRRRGEFSGRHLRLGIVTAPPRLVDRVAGWHKSMGKGYAGVIKRYGFDGGSRPAAAVGGSPTLRSSRLVIEIRGRADLAFRRRGCGYRGVEFLVATERPDPPLIAGEREMLRVFLDFHRATLAMKCDGLTDDQLRERSMPPSTLTLLGLVRHMAEVERIWFRRAIAGEDLPLVWTDEIDFQARVRRHWGGRPGGLCRLAGRGGSFSTD